MDWRHISTKLTGPLRTNFSEILIKIQQFLYTEMNAKYRLQNGGKFVSASMS